MTVVCVLALMAAVIMLIMLGVPATSADTPNRCNTVETHEIRDEDIQHYDRMAALPVMRSLNYTSIGIQWNVSAADAQDVCSFTVHVWKTSQLTKELKVANTHSPDSRNFTIENLDIGTNYEIIVETIYASAHRPLSYTLRTNTLGYGPDFVCNCFAPGTKLNRTGPCDAYTGQCDCRDARTLGRRCDECDIGFFLHPTEGCVMCDQCPPAKYGGDGSCRYNATELMVCNCLEGHTGKHCRECEEGYNKQQISEPSGELISPMSYVNCIKCNCTRSENRTYIKACYAEKGDCKSCLFAPPVCHSCVFEFNGDLNRVCIDLMGAGAASSVLAVILVLLLLFVIGVLLFFLHQRRLRMRRQRAQRYMAGPSLKGTDYDYDQVKFSAMMEEPDIDFNQQRKN